MSVDYVAIGFKYRKIINVNASKKKFKSINKKKRDC